MLTEFSSPAGVRPAGANPVRPVDAVLADGRTAAPTGDAIFVGTHPLGVALSPDGHYAIVANADQRTNLPAPSSDLVSGYSLVSVDARTMRVASVYHSDVTSFFAGVASVRDPQNAARTLVLAVDGANNVLRIFDLGEDGSLALETQSVPMPGAAGTHVAADGRAYPVSIDIAPDGRYAYVANNFGSTVAAVDIASRKLMHSAVVGFYPGGVASDATHVYVANAGLAQYHPLAQAARAPQFTAPAADPYKSSSLSVVSLAGNDDIAANALPDNVVRLDPVPDGVDAIGGARPGAIALSVDRKFAYVALSNVDRISVISLGGAPRVEDGLDLRLFPTAPFGTEPSGIAVGKDKRIYVALAGLNSIAVLDARNPVKLHRLGLIPTADFPSALTLSPDGRYLFVVAAKGVDGWGELQRVDLKTVPLMKTTLSALSYVRKASPARPTAVVPALRSGKKSSLIDRIVYISVGTPSFDALFGDLPSDASTVVNSDASLAAYGGGTTPNLHALATTYGLADNFYAADLNVDANRTMALSGTATLYTQRTLPVNASRTPLDAHGVDPENYPREGYLFNSLARAGMGYRDYGGLLDVSGYSPQAPPRGRNAATGLGGAFALDVPSLAALEGHVDLSYPLENSQIGNLARAQEFINDMDRYVKADAQPVFTYIWLPSSDARDSIAESDRAVGAIVDYLSHTPHWASTAIFIAGDGVTGQRDHVNPARSYAIVVSPLAKRHYVGKNHLATASILKTEEELLGLPPLSLNDLTATDLADFFSDESVVTPYQAQQ